MKRDNFCKTTVVYTVCKINDVGEENIELFEEASFTVLYISVLSARSR
jgi:hypothetical protein